MIREAQLADIDDIFNLEQGLFFSPWSRVSIEAEFYKDYSYVYVYTIDNIIVGYIIIWYISGEAEVINIAVVKEYQGQGIGRSLLEYVLSEYPADQWHLEVDCMNVPAINLYKSYEFQITGKIQNYYGENRHAFRMLKHSIQYKEQKDDT